MENLIKVLSVVLSIIFAILFIYFLLCTDRVYQKVTVQIVDCHKRDMITTGKVTVPADYTIVVLYNGVQYDVDVSSDLYYVFIDMIGSSVPAYYCVETRNNEIVNTYITFSK